MTQRAARERRGSSAAAAAAAAGSKTPGGAGGEARSAQLGCGGCAAAWAQRQAVQGALPHARGQGQEGESFVSWPGFLCLESVCDIYKIGCTV
jgi:hypothetical protein